MRYSIDSSALIFAWQFPYSPQRFPSFWRKMDDLINDGVLSATDEVRQELSRKQDELYKWVQQRKHMFVPNTSDIQREANRIMDRFTGLVNANSTKPEADPFVIALAIVENCIVVTQERGGSQNRPKIPYVCAQLGVDCMDLYDFVAEQNWMF